MKLILLDPSLPSSKPSNLSGLIFLGSYQIVGSFCMAHKFTISVAPRGTWKPPIEQSSNDSRGSSNGPAGYMRNVLFMMQ